MARRRISRFGAVRTDVAIAALSGAFLGPVAFAFESPGLPASGFVALGLFVVSGLMEQPRPIWLRLIAMAIGFGSLWVVALG